MFIILSHRSALCTWAVPPSTLLMVFPSVSQWLCCRFVCVQPEDFKLPYYLRQAEVQGVFPPRFPPAPNQTSHPREVMQIFISAGFGGELMTIHPPIHPPGFLFFSFFFLVELHLHEACQCSISHSDFYFWSILISCLPSEGKVNVISHQWTVT